MFGTKAAIKLFHGIQEIVIKSLLAVQQAVIQDKHCFEMYGYDVLVDEDLTPWLIEVRCQLCSNVAWTELGLASDSPAKHCLCDSYVSALNATRSSSINPRTPLMPWGQASFIQPLPCMCSGECITLSRIGHTI